MVLSLVPITPVILADNGVIAYGSYNSEEVDRISTSNTTIQNIPFANSEEKKIVGAYIPDTARLEDMHGIDQTVAILDFLERGFSEYYFVMDNFEDPKELQSTERLLDAADNKGMRIVIILLPPAQYVIRN